MKIDFKQGFHSPSQEYLNLELTWDPNNPRHEVYAAMIVSVVKMVHDNISMSKLLNESDTNPAS